MKDKWLSFIILGFLSIVVFVFFYIRIQPIEIPRPDENELEVGSLDKPIVTFVNPARGPTDAEIVIVEYGDFECHACKGMTESLKIVQQTYPNQVKLVWKHFPNESLHPEALPAAIAAHCAQTQGVFWNYHDKLFQQQELLSESLYPQIARELDLDMERFENCTQQQDTLPIVQRDFEEALALGLTATPTIYIGDEIFVGAVTLDELLNTVKEQVEDVAL